MYIFMSINMSIGTGPNNSLHQADNRNFSRLYLMQNRREAHMFYLAREVKKIEHVFAEKKVTL